MWSYGKRQCVMSVSRCLTYVTRLWRCCIRFLTLYPIHPKLTKHKEMWVLFAHAFDGVLWDTVVVYIFILYLRIVQQFLVPWGIIYMQRLNLFRKHLHKQAYIFEPMFNKLLKYSNIIIIIITEIILTPVIFLFIYIYIYIYSKCRLLTFDNI